MLAAKAGAVRQRQRDAACSRLRRGRVAKGRGWTGRRGVAVRAGADVLQLRVMQRGGLCKDRSGQDLGQGREQRTHCVGPE